MSRPTALWTAALAPALTLLVVGCGEEFGGGGGSGGAGGDVPTTTTTTTTTTTSTVTQPDIGCSDEHLDGLDAYTDIAACAGGFTEPGLATAPKCARVAGDDSTNTPGTGCAAADLCSPGWHVCATVDEVEAALGGTASDTCVITGTVFYASAIGTTNLGLCDGSSTEGFAGCGDLGVLSTSTSCGPLDRYMTGATCTADPVWTCSGGDSVGTATKDLATGGGVLCCRDLP
jgi:hypothetical protein